MKIIGMLLVVLLLVVPVMAESKYENITPDMGDGFGTLEISVLCHHNLFSQEVRIKPVGEDDWDIQVWLQPDGTYDGRFAPGLYDIWLIDGNGGQYELKYNVEVKKGQLTIVRFIGHAVTMHGNSTAPTPTVTPTVVPTVTPDPCITWTVWVEGYWTTEKVWKCFDSWQLSCWCEVIDVQVWHKGYWETITVCPP